MNDGKSKNDLAIFFSASGSLLSSRRAPIPTFSQREKEQVQIRILPRLRLRKSRSGWACGGWQKRDQGRALFERSEFARTPAFVAHHRLPEAKRRDPASRVAFSLPTFFWRSKRQVGCRRATPGQQAKAKPAKPKTHPKKQSQARPSSSITQRATTGDR